MSFSHCFRITLHGKASILRPQRSPRNPPPSGLAPIAPSGIAALAVHRCRKPFPQISAPRDHGRSQTHGERSQAPRRCHCRKPDTIRAAGISGRTRATLPHGDEGSHASPKASAAIELATAGRPRVASGTRPPTTETRGTVTCAPGRVRSIRRRDHGASLKLSPESPTDRR